MLCAGAVLTIALAADATPAAPSSTATPSASPAASPSPAPGTPAGPRARCPREIATPVLAYRDADVGKDETRYRLEVANRKDYPDDLFVAEPALDRCGSETASRTRITILDLQGKTLREVCDLHKAADLGKLWFALPRDAKPPDFVYAVLEDRRCDVKRTSRNALLR
jgi:hypothetical protein